MKEIKVTMIGPSSVGKTSLLAAIYDQYKPAINGTDLQITPEESTKASLKTRLEELKNLDNTDFLTTEWTRRTTEERTYTFELSKRGGNTFSKILFQDYPGEWLNSNSSSKQKMEDFLRESDAVIIAIDTPALMESKSDFDWHKKRNSVEEIYNVFETVYRNIISPKLIILAPVRCEAYYIKESQKYDTELLNRIKKGYEQLLNHLDSQSLIDKVAVVVTPVQTVGNVVFNSIEIDERKEPKIIFHKTGGKYQPIDSEQPLRYILRFVLSNSINSRWGMCNWLRKGLNLDKDLKEAVNKFTDSSMCKTNGGFAIIQGHSLLNIE